MDATNEQHLTSNTASILELQQQCHFITQLTSHFRYEPQQVLQDSDDVLNDYWGKGWSDDDELEEEQQRQPATWTDQEHANVDDGDGDDDEDYYVNWSEHLVNPSASSTDSVKQEENDLVALQELTRLLHQTLPFASASTVALNPLPKALQYRYEWDEPNQ